MVRLAPLAFALALAAGASAARAEATLDTASGQGRLFESDHELNVRLAGTVAVVESVQTLVNRGKRAREALYTFELPGDAALTDVSVRLADGRIATATPVDADTSVKFGGKDQVLDAEPDIGLLRLVERREADPFAGGMAIATYELRVWPAEAGRAIVVKTSWVAPLRYDDGRLSLRIPGRNTGGALVAEDVTVEVRPPKGARATGGVRGGGRVLTKIGRGKRNRYRFTAPADGDIVVEYTPELGARNRRALVSFATAAIDNNRGVVALSILAPPPSPSTLPQYERVIVVLDVSRSMSRGGIDAAGDMADAVLDAAGTTAEVEVILYDRTARRLFGELRANDRKQRAALASALTSAPLDNGSGLGLALDEVHAIFDALPAEGVPEREGVTHGLGPTTLVAVISDGMSPLALTNDRAADRIGERALIDAELLAVTIVPDDAPAPDTTAGPLGYLARRTGGRSIAVWAGSAERRAKQLAAELTRPPAIEIPTVGAPATAVLEGLLLPAKIEPGRGVFAVGTYEGRAPARLEVTATVKGNEVIVPARRAGKSLRIAALRLWLAQADLEEFVPEASRLDPKPQDAGRYDDKTLALAARTLLGVTEKAPVVTRHSALLVTDPRDPFSEDRFAFTKKWGPSLFFRVPPPPEQNTEHEFRELTIIAAPTGNANPAWRPTGDLDFAIVARLMRTFVLPKAQVCYRRALAKDPKLAGTLTVIVEVARGEVQYASIAGSTLAGSAVDDCVLEAAYTIRVPRVALGDDTEYIGVARYPIKFKRVGKSGTASKGEAPKRTEPAADDPLGGLPD